MFDFLKFKRFVIKFYVLNKLQHTMVHEGYWWTANLAGRSHLDQSGMCFANGIYVIEQIPED